jgi:predicted deacylase
MMAEIGGGGRLENEYIEVAVTGIRNLLKYAEMIPGKPEVPGEQIHVTSRKHIRCASGGMAIMDVVPGQFLKKGGSIAHIIDVGSEKSEVESIQADRDMYIITTRVNPPVDTGDRIAFVALEWKDQK